MRTSGVTWVPTTTAQCLIAPRAVPPAAAAAAGSGDEEGGEGDGGMKTTEV